MVIVIGYFISIFIWIVLIGMLAPQGGGVAVFLFLTGLFLLGWFGVNRLKRVTRRQREAYQEVMLVEREQSNRYQAGANSSPDFATSHEDRETLQRLYQQGYGLSEHLNKPQELPAPKWLPAEFRKHW